jgi:hypothetical protein
MMPRMMAKRSPVIAIAGEIAVLPRELLAVFAADSLTIAAAPKHE